MLIVVMVATLVLIALLVGRQRIGRRELAAGNIGVGVA
jgi:hypothetical protein